MQADLIKLYCDVAEQGSFSRGAEMNGVTQSAASQRINGLEKDLGNVLLLDRTKRPLVMTEAGKLFFQEGRRLLERYEQLLKRVKEIRGQMAGQLRIAAIYSAGIDLLNQVREDFDKLHPSAEVEIDYLQPDRVYDEVKAGKCDFGILSYPERWRGLASIPLRDERMVVVCLPDHPLASRQVIHPADLDDARLVSFDLALPIGRRIEAYLKLHDATPEITGHLDNVDTIKTYVRDLGAVAILPDRTVWREVDRGLLAAVRLEPPLVRPIAIVHLKNKSLGLLARTFCDYLLKHNAAKRADLGATTTA